MSLVPPQHERAGDVNARVGAGDDTDQEGEGKVVDFATAEDEERECCQEHGTGSNNRSAQRLVQRLVHHFFKRAAQPELQVFPNSVEDDYGVIGGETDDRQDGGDGGGVKLSAKEAVNADGHQHVMNDGQNRAHREGELISECDIDQNTEQGEQRRDQG